MSNCIYKYFQLFYYLIYIYIIYCMKICIIIELLCIKKFNFNFEKVDLRFLRE